MNKEIMIKGLYSTLDKVKSFDKILIDEFAWKSSGRQGTIELKSENEDIAGITIKKDHKFYLHIYKTKTRFCKPTITYHLEFSMSCGTINTATTISKEEYDTIKKAITIKQEELFTKLVS